MTPKKNASPAVALRAALADYTKATYGVAIESYSEEWVNSPDGDPRYPYEGLELVHLFNRLASAT
jgi:hypothetical protein